MVDDDDDDDGRTPDHGHPISSPCEPNGSGELKMCISQVQTAQNKMISTITEVLPWKDQLIQNYWQA